MTKNQKLRMAKAVARMILGAASRTIQDSEGIQGWEFKGDSYTILILKTDTRKSQRTATLEGIGALMP